MLDDINIAFNKIWGQIFTADGRWQLDDANATDFPIATTDLISGQNDYTLSTSFLQIKQIEIQLISGLWRPLKPIDERDIADQGIAPSYYQTIQAIPIWYDLLGESIILYPTPNYSKTAAIKAWFDRGPIEFTSADITAGTRLPGFNSVYHELIPLWVAYDYWMINDPSQVPGIFRKIQIVESTMKLDYGLRNRDDKPFITMERLRFM